MAEKIKIFALGGLDEHGKNMYVIELDNDIFVIEAGLKYPDRTRPGIDFVIPNHKYLVDNKARVRAYIITHGHDDQFGALPFIYKQVPAPVISTKPTLMMLNRFTKSAKVDVMYNEVEILPTSSHTFNGHDFSFFQTTHSAMSSFGFALKTKQGYIVYTGDFIVEYKSGDRYKLDLNRIAKIAEKDVLCLLAESGAAERVGYTSPNHRLLSHIEPIFREAKGRVFIALYEQSTYNLEELIAHSLANGRKIAFYDRVTEQYFQEFAAAGFPLINFNSVIHSDDLLRVREQDLCIVMLGNGEDIFNKVLELAHGLNKDRKVVLKETDTFIMATPPPATLEVVATEALDSLYQAGVHVVNIGRDKLKTMHAQEEDLRMILSLLKPKYYIPVKGLFRQQIANAQVAFNSGLKYGHNNILVIDNGVPVEFKNGIGQVKLHKLDEVVHGDVLVDGTGIGDINRGVIEDRHRLSEDGVIIMAVGLNMFKREISAGPDVQMRGFVYLKDSDLLLRQIRNLFITTVNGMLHETKTNSLDEISEEIVAQVERFIFRETRRKPMILPLLRIVNK